MSAYIYLEGGASGPNSKVLNIRCERAFHKLLDKMGFVGRKPRLVACGGRNDVYRAFIRGLRLMDTEYVGMWIDSEEPMSDHESAWRHLGGVTTVAVWDRPEGAEDDQVLFMSTCMETWIVADRAALRDHYKEKLKENALPHTGNLENIQRRAVQQALELATGDCKNAYTKGKRSFDILEKLDPDILKRHLPSFVRVHRILSVKL